MPQTMPWIAFTQNIFMHQNRISTNIDQLTSAFYGKIHNTPTHMPNWENVTDAHTTHNCTFSFTFSKDAGVMTEKQTRKTSVWG